MKLRHICLCGLMMLAAACAKNKEPAESNLPKVVLPAPRSNDDYALMEKALTFTPAEKKKFDKALADRNAAYEKWANSAEGRQYYQLRGESDKATAAGDTAKAGEIKTQMAPLSKKQEETRANIRRDFDRKGLTLAQQRQWAGYLMYGRISAKLRADNLSAEQLKKVRTICDDVATETVTADTHKTDPYLRLNAAADDKAMARVRQTVLTK